MTLAIVKIIKNKHNIMGFWVGTPQQLSPLLLCRLSLYLTATKLNKFVHALHETEFEL